VGGKEGEGRAGVGGVVVGIGEEGDEHGGYYTVKNVTETAINLP
jgi:hypothetical protein